MKAPRKLMRCYLDFFWEKIVFKDRRIVEAVPALLFRSIGVETAPPQEKASKMPTSSSVRSFSEWLPGPSGFITLLRDAEYWNHVKSYLPTNSA